MPVLVNCKNEADPKKKKKKKKKKKMKPLRCLQNFSHVKSMGAICCHGNQSSNPICSLPLPDNGSQEIWSRSAHWFQRYTSLKVWTTDDGWRRRSTDHTILIPHRSLRLRWAKNANVKMYIRPLSVIWNLFICISGKRMNKWKYAYLYT